MAGKRTFLHDAIDFANLGAHSLENDDFSDCFRSVSPYEMRSSGALYVFSFIIRYFVLLPIRLVMLAMAIVTAGLYFLCGKYFKKYSAISDSFTLFNKLMMFVLNCKISHIGVKCMHKEPHIYVSNHTSFIDYMVLSSHKFSHACISEGHGGLFGFILMKILSENGSIGFNRSEKQDRSRTLEKVREHIHENMSPILIFPEGTCVNNRYAVLFQKGAFELDALVCPVAIKYKKNLLDPYWNRRRQGFILHMFYLLTRWGISAEVHWMDPMRAEENESSISFSHRVKISIAKRIGLKNTLWNGSFKSSPVLSDREILKECFNDVYCKIAANTLLRDEEEDRQHERFYFFDENVDHTAKDSRLYFGGVPYKSFINHCCKEYLRAKEKRSSGCH